MDLRVAKQNETKFKEKVWDDLKTLRKTWAHKTQEVAKRGVPDFILCVNGWFVALELKTEDGRLEPLQEYKLEKILEADGSAYKVTPGNWPMIFSDIKRLSERRD